ncbi:hypothetical protein PHISCL_03321 [Aspergillus sclerotialis]|uniref:Uncharacterized protein n=1 Tax=Aspergillus sclerotialis TaxID=2070753 RepID=A0A3A2ZMS7_9EURO|nr:hypothetical protein PHISCL_03321 [Aspergillus sclerotialis]
MKTFTITAVAIAALSSLGLTTPLEKRFDVSITFHGAGDQEYSVSIPTDRTKVEFNNPMVVHKVSSPGGGFCTLVGKEGESVVIYAEDEQVLDTPQAMDYGTCGNN